AASCDGADQVPGSDDKRGQEDEADRPWPFAVLEIAVVVAEIQRDRSGERGEVEQREPDPRQLCAIQESARAARSDVVRHPDQRDAGPAVKRRIGMDRAQTPE